MGMSKTELIKKLKELIEDSKLDTEMWHYNADMLLLEYIDSEEVTRLFKSEKKWYA